MKRLVWKHWAWLAGALVAAALVAVPTVPKHQRRDPGAALAQCSANLKNVGVALEMYSTDNAGRYPASLAALVPDYLQVLPTCPSAGAETFSASYTRVAIPFDAYTVFCRGDNHRDAGLGSNLPQTSSSNVDPGQAL